MITIGICDDEPGYRRIIKEFCEQFFEKIEQEHQYIEFASGEEVLSYTGPKLYLLFLDVELGGVDGIEVLKFVQEADWIWRIVFVSSHAEAVWDSFSIKTLEFARKPIAYEQVEKWIQIALRENQENILYEFLTTAGSMYKKMEDIYILEGERNYTYLHTKKEKWLINDSLKRWQEKMDKTTMLRVHRSFLVNMAHIKKWEKETIYMCNGSKISVGRQYAKEAKDTYLSYIQKKALGRM